MKTELTLEQIKQLSWKDYIKSKYWINFRKTILDDINAVCELCGKHRWETYKKTGLKKNKPTMQFHIHHLDYNHLGEETRENVMCLCSSCHNFFHDAEMMARTRKGIYTIIYTEMLEQTKWKYEPFKDKEVKTK